MLNTYYVWLMFSPNMLNSNLRNIKKTKTVLYGFIEIVNESKRQQNKLWFNHNDILLYAAHNEDKSVVAKIVAKTLVGKIYKKIDS